MVLSGTDTRPPPMHWPLEDAQEGQGIAKIFQSLMNSTACLPSLCHQEAPENLRLSMTKFELQHSDGTWAEKSLFRYA